VDSKKKELIGCFKNPGATWTRVATPVKDHDFRSEADAVAVPYGIFDTVANRGHVVVGTSMTRPPSRPTPLRIGGERGKPTVSAGGPTAHPRRQRRQQRLELPGMETATANPPL